MKSEAIPANNCFCLSIFFGYWVWLQAGLCMASFFSSALHVLLCFALDCCCFLIVHLGFSGLFYGLLNLFSRYKSCSWISLPKLRKSALFWARKGELVGRVLHDDKKVISITHQSLVKYHDFNQPITNFLVIGPITNHQSDHITSTKAAFLTKGKTWNPTSNAIRIHGNMKVFILLYFTWVLNYLIFYFF